VGDDGGDGGANDSDAESGLLSKLSAVASLMLK
jgi:hypothetical protein